MLACWAGQLSTHLHPLANSVPIRVSAASPRHDCGQKERVLRAGGLTSRPTACRDECPSLPSMPLWLASLHSPPCPSSSNTRDKENRANTHTHTHTRSERTHERGTEGDASERLACWGCGLATSSGSWLDFGLLGSLARRAPGWLVGCLSSWQGGWLADWLARRNIF